MIRNFTTFSYRWSPFDAPKTRPGSPLTTFMKLPHGSSQGIESSSLLAVCSTCPVWNRRGAAAWLAGECRAGREGGQEGLARSSCGAVWSGHVNVGQPAARSRVGGRGAASRSARLCGAANRRRRRARVVSAIATTRSQGQKKREWSHRHVVHAAVVQPGAAERRSRTLKEGNIKCATPGRPPPPPPPQPGRRATGPRVTDRIGAKNGFQTFSAFSADNGRWRGLLVAARVGGA